MSSERLNLKTPLLVFVAFILLVGLLLWLGNFFSNQRRDQIYLDYSEETSQFIAENKYSLMKLFIEIFPDGNCPTYDYQPSKPTIPCPSQDTIAKLTNQALKDWSSTAFLKLVGGKAWIMRLAGETKELYSYPREKETKVIKLLSGQIEKVEWDDYSYDLPGKEVITVVKDDSGKILGAIIRGVIEK